MRFARLAMLAVVALDLLLRGAAVPHALEAAAHPPTHDHGGRLHVHLGGSGHGDHGRHSHARHDHSHAHDHHSQHDENHGPRGPSDRAADESRLAGRVCCCDEGGVIFIADDSSALDGPEAGRQFDPGSRVRWRSATAIPRENDLPTAWRLRPGGEPQGGLSRSPFDLLPHVLRI